MSFYHQRQQDHPANCPCKYVRTPLSSFTAAQFGTLHRRGGGGAQNDNGVAKPSPPTTTRAAAGRLLDGSGYTALHYAAQNGHLRDVKWILSSLETSVLVDGVPRSAGGCGATPLHRAAYSGAVDVVEALCDAGADLLARDSSVGDLATPLHKAVEGGRPAVARALSRRAEATGLAARALAARDARGRTPAAAARAIAAEIDADVDAEEERRSGVARWNGVAGNTEPDWRACRAILAEAETRARRNLRSRREARASAEDHVTRATTDASALCAVCPSPAVANQTVAPPDADERVDATPADKLDRATNKDDARTPAESSEQSPPSPPAAPSSLGRRCASCDKVSIVLRRAPDDGSLVCGSCARRRGCGTRCRPRRAVAGW